MVFASTTAVLFVLDWRLALVTLVFLPGLVVPARPVGQARKRIRRSAQAQLAELTGLLDETLSVSGILLTRIFGAERFETERIRRQSAEIRQLALKQALVGRWFQMFMAVFEAAGPALVFGVGGYLIMAGRVGVGTVVAFATLLKRLYSSASAVMGVQVDVVTSYAYFERVFRVLDMPREQGGGPGAIALPRVEGALTLEGVSLEYEDGTEGLSAVDLHVPPGQCVAIVGPSGAGKSTLVALLLRLHDPTSGRILLDGHDLRTIELGSLRSHIGVVTQETYLFHGTVLDNLLYARPDATRDQIEAAARAAQIHDLVASLARRVRDGRRPARLPALGRREAAPGHRAGDPEGSANPAAGRGDQLSRLPQRGPDRGGSHVAPARPDEPGRRAPAVDRPPGGLDLRLRQREGSGSVGRTRSCSRPTGCTPSSTGSSCVSRPPSDRGAYVPGAAWAAALDLAEAGGSVEGLESSGCGTRCGSLRPPGRRARASPRGS